VGVVATVTGVPDAFPETQRAVAGLEAWFATQPETVVLSLVAKGVIAAGIAKVLSITLADDLRNSMQHAAAAPRKQLRAPW
jgi:hypothetical protein